MKKRFAACMLAFSLMLQLPGSPAGSIASASTETSEDVLSGTDADASEDVRERADAQASEDVRERTDAQADSVILTITLEEAEPSEYPFALGEQDLAYQSSDGVTTITINNAAGLIKLSHCDPQQIQGAKLDIQITGSVTLTGQTVEKDGIAYRFNGIGSKEHPFAGAFTGQSITFLTDQPLFRAVMSSVDFHGNAIQWESKIGKNEQGIAQKPMLAEYYRFADTEEHDLSAIRISAKAGGDVVMGPLFGEICGEAGTLKIGNEVDYSGAAVEVYQAVEGQNAGLICNTLSAGSVIVTGSFAAPASYTVTALDGHAGGIIGEMKPGTALMLQAAVTKPKVTGRKDAGGAVGHAVDAQISGTGSITAAAVEAKEGGTGAVQSGSAGGIAGYLEYTYTEQGNPAPALQALNITGVALTAPRAAGGLYGTLKLAPGLRAELSLQSLQNGLSVSKITAGSEKLCQYYGGLIGVLEGGTGADGSVPVLTVDGAQNGGAATLVASKAGTQNIYQGGVVGCIGQADAPVTLFLGNITAAEEQPEVAEVEEASFGGLAGRIEEDSIAVLGGTAAFATTDAILCGGGLVGTMQPRSVLSLSGTTDLRHVSYQESEKAGQLVGKQDCALVFAAGSGKDTQPQERGWRYIRSSQKAKLDDIGNYGQVLRLNSSVEGETANSSLSSDLLQVYTAADTQDTAKVGRLAMKPYSGSDFSIDSEDDFALFSILWQSHGAIKAANIPENAYDMLSNAGISLTADIDLTGTGVTGLTRDVTEPEAVFHGSIDGGNHCITLAVGEAYGCFAADSGEVQAAVTADGGCGRVYRHNALGLFASADGNVSSLVIDGCIDVESYAAACYAGGIAGLIEGGTPTITDVTAQELIVCGNAAAKQLTAGGLYGAVSKTSTVTFGAQDHPVTSRAAIKVTDVHDGKYMMLGGLIGAVVEVNASSTSNRSVFNMINVSLTAPKSEYGSINLDGTAITDAQSFFAGGLIGAMLPYQTNQTKTVMIGRVTIDGYAVESMNTSGSNSICGGLLGSLWTAADVTFGMPEGTSDTYALNVINGTSKADKASHFGGLVYAASGKWTIHNHGIDLSGASFSAENASSFGVLVQDAYNGNAYIAGSSRYRGALYIELTAHWDEAYRLSSGEKEIAFNVNSNASFDEFAAYTAESDVWLSERNGVISLHTEKEASGADSKKLIMDGANINSYQNRTQVGKTKNTNSHSRYYYNLDQMYETVKDTALDTTDNGRIDICEELMLWSVYRYAAGNLRTYFTAKDVTNSAVIGGPDGDNPVSFDLKGYSYYPIDLLNMNLTVQNADFTFYNQEIEKGENAKSNKNTSTDTQHEGMHCGLFRNYLRQSSESATIRSYQLTADHLSFAGTIGKLNGSSGALLCGKVEGNDTNGNNIFTVAASDIVLKDIAVREMLQDSTTGYAPLLIAETSGYSATSMSRVQMQDYPEGQKAATSLIGKAGSEKATQINLSFSEMNIPSEKEKSPFTHASFLESFRYSETGVGTAVYNFTKADQAAGYVTFGMEIDGTKEYPGMQLWYYDESGYGTDANLVSDGTITASKEETVSNFGGKYLPYVYEPYQGEASGESSTNYHEIEVNHRIVDITEGCGTYADPYVIKNSTQLETIASFLQTGSMRKNWRVTITADQTAICKRLIEDPQNPQNTLDTTYVCDGVEWKMENGPEGASDSISNETMRNYLLSAYYDIQADLTLKDFIGLGSKARGFRGVVTSTNGSYITLTGDKTSKGLIPYSYGAVVKDLTIAYKKEDQKGLVIQYTAKDAFDPTAFFGGVIGVILGGDNIIDNVTVTMEDGFLTLTGDKPHLIQVGGYVGSISGGGVIFRNMDAGNGSGMQDGWLASGKSGWTPSTAENAYQSLYVNHYVGRVLDGFAFSEGCTVDNTDKNYKINDLGAAERNTDGSLKSDGSIAGGTMLGNTKGGSYLQINDAVGLLAFSAILNSGASAGPAYKGYQGTRAYAGGDGSKVNDKYRFGNDEFGKVRCAAYDQIGKPQAAAADFKVALRDDRIAPGLQNTGGGSIASNLNAKDADVNLCYLAARFGDKYAMFAAVSNISDVRYVFKKDTTYDMTTYGNGYQGIGCRYKANAGTNLAATTANYDRVVPWIRYVQGNGATIKASIQVREYNEDDYWTMGVGGVFAYTYFYNDTILNENDQYALSDLTVSDSTVSLKYYDADGAENSAINSNRKASVGGFAGAQTGTKSIGTVKNVTVESSTIEGGYSAAGLFGSVGRVAFTASATGTHFLTAWDDTKGETAVNFIDCGYQNLSVSGYYYSGGFVGEMRSKTDAVNLIQGAVLGTQASDEAGAADTHEQSEIRSTAGTDKKEHQISAGGLIGKYQVGTLTIEGSEANPVSSITDVSVYGYGKAGGLIGWILSTTLLVENVEVKGCAQHAASVAADSIYDGSGVNFSAVGGILGRNQDSKVMLSSCHVTDMKIGSGKETAAGGLVGDSVVVTTGTTALETFDCSVVNCQIKAGAKENNRCYAGGVVGLLGNTWVGSNLLLQASTVDVDGAAAGQDSSGLLAGCLLNFKINYGKQFTQARVAGISIQGLDESQLARKEIGNQSDADAVLGKCYFAYANYEGNPSGSQPEEEISLLGAEGIRPYAVTSPASALTVWKEEQEYHLFGDGAAWSEQTQEDGSSYLKTKAQTIWEESGKEDSQYFRYTGTGLESFDFSKRISTYLENQKNMPSEETGASDFPVLLVSGGNTQVILDYLNLLTNGGYNQAVSLAPEHISAATRRCKWDSGKNAFVCSPERASLRIDEDGSFVVTREYDNNQDQFTLLTVTFTETSEICAGQAHTYQVQIPLIVRRVVEVDFTATLYYGANLAPQAYDLAKHHVLESFGNTISGYLTWRYNSAYGEAVEYGWRSFAEEGGNIAQVMEKTLLFEQKNTFPAGTQLTLIEEESGAVYYKTITSEMIEKGEDRALSLSTFQKEDGSFFASKTIGEIMSVKAEEAPEGDFIRVEEDGSPFGTEASEEVYEKPSVFADGYYYRLAKTDGTEAAYQRYALQVEESQPEENYYLVITIPQVSADPINGKLETQLGGEIPYHMNYKLRNEDREDLHSNTASTYLISEGYRQALKETLEERLNVSQSIQKMSGIERSLYVSIKTEITFPNEQAYQEEDALFQAFTANLQTYSKENNATESVKLPSQTEGTVHFYVMDENGSYYSCHPDESGKKLVWIQAESKTEATKPYVWSSTGESMELLLSADGTEAGLLDLQGMRDLIRGDKRTGDSKFSVEAVLEAAIPAAGLDVIPESELVNGIPESDVVNIG